MKNIVTLCEEMFHDEPLTIDFITLQTIQVKLDLTLILISFGL